MRLLMKLLKIRKKAGGIDDKLSMRRLCLLSSLLGFILFSSLGYFGKIDASYAEEASISQLKTEEIFQSLDQAGQDKFSRILVAHGLISSVKYTQETMKKAVASCREHNPNLQSEIKKNFKGFQSSLRPILKKADGAFSRTLALEEVKPLKEMKTYFDLVDQEALATHSKVNPVPIQDKESCETLNATLQNEIETSRLVTILNQSFGFEIKDSESSSKTP